MFCRKLSLAYFFANSLFLILIHSSHQLKITEITHERYFAYWNSNTPILGI